MSLPEPVRAVDSYVNTPSASKVTTEIASTSATSRYRIQSEDSVETPAENIEDVSTTSPSILRSSPSHTLYGNGSGAIEMSYFTPEDILEAEEDTVLIAPVPQDHTKNQFANVELLGAWYPKNKQGHPKAETFGTRLSKRHSLLYICFGLAFLVLTVNVSALAVFRTKWTAHDDFGTLFHGDCKVSARISTLAHLVINILSTLLLASSNLCMQLLASPTRREVDAAHKKGLWVDIGTPSFRNLKAIHKLRLIVWCILGLSSLPLHFFYNSVIAPTIPVNSYTWAMVTPAFMSGAAWNVSETRYYQTHWPGFSGEDWASPSFDIHFDTQIRTIQEVYTGRLHLQNSSFLRLENADCFTQYRKLFGNHSDLLLITKGVHIPAASNKYQIPPEYVPSAETIMSNSLLAYGRSRSETWEAGWLFCSNTNAIECIQPADNVNVTGWNIGGFEIDYCLSAQQSLENRCSVQYSSSLLIVICVFNATKLCCIAFTIVHFLRRRDPSLSILGGAMASFLQYPDLNTTGLESYCTRAQVVDKKGIWTAPVPTTWPGKRSRMFKAVSWKRWITLIGFALIVLISASIFLIQGIAGLKFRKGASYDASYLFKLGFGGVHPESLLGFLHGSTRASLYANVFFANSWQFEISIIYLVANSILSTMFVAREWDRYSMEGKYLRVTSRTGYQRSSYFISIPARYELPYITAFGVLHWTISQSVFIVQIERFTSKGTTSPGQRLIVCGYSCFAIIISLILGSAIVLSIFLCSYKTLPNALPLAATCSAAISASCRSPEGDTEAHKWPLRYGVVEQDKNGARLAFSTYRGARMPEVGEMVK
ncbi:hypothetical protein VTL71DRAFT_2608 [Oculimacula yallundae]|uniref:DUF6536 domain-containing protein n=1 Tax=Oculimacula yallundae TaxID=86028 RepID=A0ABR4CA32_9HELO